MIKCYKVRSERVEEGELHFSIKVGGLIGKDYDSGPAKEQRRQIKKGGQGGKGVVDTYALHLKNFSQKL